jgi:hypothetical protein
VTDRTTRALVRQESRSLRTSRPSDSSIRSLRRFAQRDRFTFQLSVTRSAPAEGLNRQSDFRSSTFMLPEPPKRKVQKFQGS